MPPGPTFSIVAVLSSTSSFLFLKKIKYIIPAIAEIKIMRKNLKPGSFRLWRKRVHNTSIKHRKKFKLSRKKIREKIRISDIY